MFINIHELVSSTFSKELGPENEHFLEKEEF